MNKHYNFLDEGTNNMDNWDSGQAIVLNIGLHMCLISHIDEGESRRVTQYWQH